MHLAPRRLASRQDLWRLFRLVIVSTDLIAAKLLVQLGYLFPGTAWEIAARASGWDLEVFGDAALMEYAFGVNYYLNGHGNKLSIDAAFVEGKTFGALIFDPYAGYPGSAPGTGTGDGSYGMLLRFQWQLAL